MICVNKSHDNIIPGKFGLLTTPLQRIVTGTFLVALAFLMSGVLEIELRRGYPEVPGAGQIKLFIHNGLESGCNLQVTSFDENISSQETKYAFLDQRSQPYPLKITSSPGCNGQNFTAHLEMDINVSFPLESKTVLVYRDANNITHLYESTNEDKIEKDNNDPMPFVRFVAK